MSLCSHSKARRQELLSLSQPGGHPRVWMTVSRTALHATRELTLKIQDANRLVMSRVAGKNSVGQGGNIKKTKHSYSIDYATLYAVLIVHGMFVSHQLFSNVLLCLKIKKYKNKLNTMQKKHPRLQQLQIPCSHLLRPKKKKSTATRCFFFNKKKNTSAYRLNLSKTCNQLSFCAHG